MKFNYKHTLYASYLGYITQAIINNLPALLFIVFQKQFKLSLSQIGCLISLNFAIQIMVDLISAKYADKIGYRTLIVAAHLFAISGLFLMGTLPFIINPYIALIISITLNAIGGGIIEVLISPIVESLPGDEKASAMSLLHSFYCWGHVAVVILSTLYFLLIGLNKWFYLPLLWSIIPLINVFLFINVPLRKLVEENEIIPLKSLFSAKVFWILFVLMICSGAAEQAMSQWSSLFAELGLGISKSKGDLLGPCSFAGLMGLARLFFGIYGSKINLQKVLIYSSVLCIFSYSLAVFSKNPLISLLGCALCGLSVGIMWPGTFSLSSLSYPKGGTAIFAILALAGDIGCSIGPGLVGFVSNIVIDSNITLPNIFIVGKNITQIALKHGLLFAMIFPITLILGIILLNKNKELSN